ncbi:Oidioi.mRNA.OKI2018_I69.PAR.g9828.t1.cds [Oikopleura dioica]|uniref:Oidioi.mRNA.OKI2018_I69.PAR.g9828.t1.cds n=1 Tax=Oikopleura dioica TaxID=34765 RepID=A0ABN7RV97_OIKDI|nr:Oidioi.mRNA.OKI2018_I69.PAR.g9828.t1.cds [Oikopleura dioica]
MFKTFSFVEFAQEIEGTKMNQSHSSHLQKALGSLEPVRVPFDPRASLFNAKNRKERATDNSRARNLREKFSE